MVKLTPDEQREFVRGNRDTFVPASGAWGRQGCTMVRLDAVDEDTLGEAMTLAWQNTARSGVARRRNARQTTRRPGHAAKRDRGGAKSR